MYGRRPYAALPYGRLPVIASGGGGGGTTTPLTLTANCSTTASFLRGVGKTLLANCTSTSTLVRSIAKLLTATATTTVTGVNGRAFLRVLTATCNTTVSFITGSVVAKLLTATATTTASLIKRPGLRLLATCTTTSSVIRSIAKRLTATATSTASAVVYKGVVYVRNLSLTVTTTAAVNALYQQFVKLLQSDALKLYKPNGYPTIKKDDPSTYILAELRKISAFMEQHVQVTKDLEQRINAGGL